MKLSKKEISKIEEENRKINPFYDEMILVEGGEFYMGSETSSNESPIHKVIIPSFLLQKTPVTQGQWQKIMGKNPSHFLIYNFIRNTDALPVEQISWDDVQDFISTLNQKSQKNYRLPSESEWEFAARGGVKSCGYTYSGANSLKEVGWYMEYSTIDRKTHYVMWKKPNELGLYDMSGNVNEWVEDNWSENYKNSPNDGSAWLMKENKLRVIRGGSGSSVAFECRSTYRRYSQQNIHSKYIGFRLAHDFVPT